MIYEKKVRPFISQEETPTPEEGEGDKPEKESTPEEGSESSE